MEEALVFHRILILDVDLREIVCQGDRIRVGERVVSLPFIIILALRERD